MAEGEIAFLSFTERGEKLAKKIQSRLGGWVACAHGQAGFSLGDWTGERFQTCKAIVYVGAAGIAVRAIAPFLRNKAKDPAVVSLDEGGSFVIPLVSGHLGGANALAREIAEICGGTAVITTATDVNGVFAVDSWAKRQHLTVLQPERIKAVSAKRLSGQTVSVYAPWPIRGEPPTGVKRAENADEADVVVDVRPHAVSGLCLAPKTLVLGIGCRRGIAPEELERVFTRFCGGRGILPESVCRAASIDRKAEEAGLLAFCGGHGWETDFYSAGELRAVSGAFTPSPFVERTVGVDNVCERSAVLSAKGSLVEQKYAENGVTMAAACRTPELDWSW
ncbi:MAG: cobalt-precorrin 5A hydrolase [Oscillospiraceae bacterium]|nr:cobalt-precorrin 5A hydrolase [Oscillospiraceae bacterium]